MKYVNGFIGAVAALVLSAGLANAQAPLNDAQLLGVLGIANGAEIDAGKVAVDRGQKQEVKDFATKMVAEHTANNVKLQAVELKVGFVRAESDVSNALKQNADAMITALKNAATADFDKLYIDGQVTMHQDLLTQLDQSFIPGAQNADVKAYLQETRAAVEGHLNEAKTIQASLATP